MGRLRFHCPRCEAVNEIGVGKECVKCTYPFLQGESIYNLVSPDTDRASEQQFYDSVYGRVPRVRRKSVTECSAMWNVRHQPELSRLREAVGSLTGRDVLLLGNGSSEKELAFLLDRPRTLVYSDLSPNAPRQMQASYELSGHMDRLIFAAVDAQKIPFCEGSFDLVYGFAMVHHLPDLRSFVREVCRVLRQGGRAVFFDDAYSPIWHASKQTFLKPLMRYSHRTTGISPEDYRFSMTGGFKEKDLAEVIRSEGAEPWFERASLVTYVTFRGAEKLLPQSLAGRLRSSFVASSTAKLDRFLGKFELFRANQIRLIWGFAIP